MPRFAAVVLPRVHIEIARTRLGAETGRGVAPLGVVVARAGGTVQRETDLLGNTRIDEVSREAAQLGVRRGQTIAAARAKTAELCVRVVHVDEVREALARVAEAALAFGATTSFEDGVVWADVTGCAHLFGGEATLAHKLGERVRAMGHACRVALADGPRVAAAVALHAPSHRAGPLVVPEGKSAVAMRALPLAALPLDDEALAWLSRVGMRTAGDLQRLPTRALGTRLGAQVKDVMGLLRGEDATPLTPYRPPATLEERVELEHGIEATEALLFVAKGLCDRVAARLEGRAMAAARIELVLSLDRAMLRDEIADASNDPATIVVSLALPSPMSRAVDLFSVLRARVDAHASTHAARAPVRAVTLRVPELARVEGRALDLFVAEPRADVALPRLAAQLAAEIGDARIGVLELCDTWVPQARTRLVPYRATGESPRSASSLVSNAPEPSRVLGAGVAPPASLSHPKLLARLEAIEWWRRGAGAIDLVVAEMEGGVVAWVEIDRASGETRLRGWMD